MDPSVVCFCVSFDKLYTVHYPAGISKQRANSSRYHPPAVATRATRYDTKFALPGYILIYMLNPFLGGIEPGGGVQSVRGQEW